MLSQKPRRRVSSPPPASRGVECARATVADRRGRATEQCASGRTSHGRARSPECSASRTRSNGPSVGLAAPAGRKRKFSSLQTIEIKRSRIGISPNPPTFRGSRCNGGDCLVEPKGGTTPRPSSVSFARNRRAGGRRWRNFPIRKRLKRLETAKESDWLVAPRADFSGTPRLTAAVSFLRVGRGRYELAMMVGAPRVQAIQ
jgi:hypothetical protein